MTNTVSTMARAEGSSLVSLYKSALGLAGSVPLSLVQLTARVAIAKVFWDSSQSKLASWPITQQLFAMEYQVPLLPPDVAAVLATATEFCGAILLLFGLFTRFGAMALLGVVTIIQLFVFPGHWGEHLTWASLLLLLLARGGGMISLDHLAQRFFARHG